jgi:hypothetical protein
LPFSHGLPIDDHCKREENKKPKPEEKRRRRKPSKKTPEMAANIKRNDAWF